MSDNRFDDFFKDSFSDYSPEVPAHIWDNIAGRKQKRRPLFFWINSHKLLLAAASLLLTGGGIFYFTSRSNNDTQNFTHNTSGSNNNIALENTNSRQDAAHTEPAPVLNNNAAGNNTVSANKNSDAPVTDAPNNATLSAPVKDNTTVTTVNQSNDLNNRNEIIADESQHNDAAVTSKRVRGKKARNLRKAVINTNHAVPFEGEGSDPGDVSLSNTMPENDVNVPDVAGRRDLIYIAIENLLAQKSTQVNPVKFREDCPGSTSGNNYYFDAYLGPDHVIKKYSDTGNSIQVSRRKESLKIQSAYSAGIRYTRVFANGISFRTGFNYSQVNEKFSYAVDNVVHIVYVINNQGDTTDSYYVRGTRYRNSFNRYRTIDVPVIMGYEMGNGNFHANINAGLMVNVYSWQSGETLDNNGAPVSITTGKANNPYQYKTNIGLGFTGAVSLYYKITNRLHVMAEPYFRYNLAPMNKDALSLQERFTTIGMRLGIRVDIK